MGTNRPLNTDGDFYTDPVNYNPYDKGYKSGAQVSLFIGPIWVEEVVTIRLGTGTDDIPVYPYSTPYFNTVLLGNYIVNGQIGINYTESDYLLRIIESARNTSIQEKELKALIKGRKSLFETTLLDHESNDYKRSRIKNYVERISREIETSSMNSNGKLDPRSFEITIIAGNIYDDNQSIEIYEDVKINRTNKIIDNGDNIVLEVYDFIGKKKPDRLSKIEVVKEVGYLSKPNILSMTEEVINKLIDSLMSPPSIEIFETKARTEEMLSTDRLAVSGYLTRNTRCYGKRSSFSEIVYSYEYPKSISTYHPVDGADIDGNTQLPIKSDTKIKIYDSINTTGVEKEVFLIPPKIEGGTNEFTNLGGNIIFPDREGCSKKIAAVAPIDPVTILSKRGGSVSLPRYNKKDFGIGSYYPPSIVDLPYSYSDSDISTITYGTLWCSTLGFRSSETIQYDEISDQDDTVLSSISQPTNTLSLVEYPTSEWDSGSSTFTIRVPIPRTVDFVNTDKGKLRSRSAMELGTTGNFLKFTIAKGSGNYGSSSEDVAEMEGPYKEICDSANAKINAVDSEYAEKETSGESLGPKYIPDIKIDNSDLYESATIQVFHERKNIPVSEGGSPVTLNPNFIRMNTTSGSEQIAATIQKSLYAIPLVFIDESKTLTITATTDEYGIVHYDPSYTNIQLDDGRTVIEAFGEIATDETEMGKKCMEYLSWYLSRKGGKDDSCKVEISYDFVVTDQSGYFDVNGNIVMDCVYFLNDVEGKLDRYVATDGTIVSRTNRGAPATAHIFWIVGILPNLQLPTGVSEDTSNVNIEHDITDRSGRKLEIYNITRCDSLLHNGTELLNASAGSQIAAAILAAFEELLHIDVPLTNYRYPHKASWERYAGFISGYSFNIEIESIVKQVLNCTFTEDLRKYINVANTNTEEFTLDAAYSFASPATGSSSLTEEIRTMITNTLIMKVNELGGRITNLGDSSILTVDVEVLIPSTNIVAYGLTKEGIEELKGYTTLNLADSSDLVNTITLGGYDV